MTLCIILLRKPYSSWDVDVSPIFSDKLILKTTTFVDIVTSLPYFFLKSNDVISILLNLLRIDIYFEL